MPASRAGWAGVGNRGAWRTLVLQQTQEASVRTYDPHKSETDVRQANPRRMNLRVLIMSVIGIVLAFAIIYLIFAVTQSGPV